jgi:polysaccharide export outer membrane protein
MKKVVLAIVMAYSLVAVGQSKPANATAKPAAEDQNATVKPATVDASYVIGAEDVINIAVWKEPDFSSTVPVRPDGKVSLALLGDVAAAGKTPGALAGDLTVLLKKYVAEPRVTVTVSAINSRRVFLLGEVNRPGPIVITPAMTVLQAIAAAGGPTAYANQKKIYVLRNDNGSQTKLPFNYKEAIKGNVPEQNVMLRPGDTIVIP